MTGSTHSNRRILLVDDNAAIHEDFKKVLSFGDASDIDLEAQADTLFGTNLKSQAAVGPNFHLDSACQGKDALEHVRKSIENGEPYAMAFVDMRMPPGWDGLETIKRIWDIDHTIETVICTAYSDHSWQDIQRALGVSDRLLILKKPFDKIEVMQLALALTEKWNLRHLASLQADGLERLVRVRTRELVEINKSKSDFLTNISHELLTPMNGILGMASLLGSTTLTEEQHEYVDGLNVSGQRLYSMLDQVLKFNSIEAGKLPLNLCKFDPKEVGQKVSDTYAARAHSKGLNIVFDGQRNLARQNGDPKQIENVLALLVDNAIKFTKTGTIRIRVAGTGTIPVGTEFAVSDSGCGMDSTRMELLNHQFIQLDSGVTRDAEGIGLGLTLAKQLLKMMNSHLEIQSEPGNGSTFSFIISDPAAAPQPKLTGYSN